jgi:hypothetical protein
LQESSFVVINHSGFVAQILSLCFERFVIQQS